MIRESDISIALGAHLGDMFPLPPIAWPNHRITPAMPYLFPQVVRGSRTDPSVAGDFAISNGQYLVTVVSELDEFTVAAEKLADDVAEHFPMGLRLAVTGGEITIMQPPEILQGFPDAVSWRIPVRITYRALKES